MLKIGICDDNVEIRRLLHSFCERFFGEDSCVISQYASGEEFFEKGCGEEYPDILLLDIEMEGMDGIQIKNILQRQKREVRILFVTSHEELALEGYGKHVFGFLVKPFDYEQLERKLRPAAEDLEQAKRYVTLHMNGPGRRVRLSEILYIEADGKYARFHLEADGRPLYGERSIGTWEEELAGSDFAMSHKSYLVNLAWVKQIRDTDLLLKNGETVRVSRRMKTGFREKYKAYIFRNAR
ncbi:MAG: response regulator transcription factor [Lachnospiraceae bacterium]|jgi:DNA-binding LytR/AlgR family response regulator|nr:response regulator transcription factor [Lachnospiraceae bacterium]